MIQVVAPSLPTAGRRLFISAAIAQFLARNHDDAELVIPDDDDPVAVLIPGDPRFTLAVKMHTAS